jgi:hypothetical protein
MRMSLPFNLLPTSKDAELRSIVPRAIPELASTTLTTGEQDGCGKVMFGTFGKDGPLSSDKGDDRDEGSTTSKEGLYRLGGGFIQGPAGLRIAPDSGVGPRMEVDYGEGSASPQKAKQDSKERRRHVSSAAWAVAAVTARRRCSGSYWLPPWAVL